MYKSYILYFVIVCAHVYNVAASSNTNSNSMRLELVHMLYRHGDRNPTHSFPSSSLPESAWPHGYGQLTTTGMRQHRELGEYFRGYYAIFLSETFNNSEIYVRSTDYDRTLMSAQSHLYGLIKPHPSMALDPAVAWQPVPVHSMPGKMDNLLDMGHSHCPRAKHLDSIFLSSSPEVTSVVKQNEWLLSYLSKHSGLSMSLSDAWHLHDCLSIMRLYKKPMPLWYTDKIHQQLDELEKYEYTLRYNDSEVIRLSGGSLLKNMIEHMDGKVTDTSQSQVKLYMYSAHDTTVSVFLKTLHLYNHLTPPYTATVLVELHRDTQGDYFVHVLYKNSSQPPHRLSIPGCEEFCPYSKFIRLTKPMVPVDLTAECSLSWHISGLDVKTVVLLLQAVVIFVFIYMGICRFQFFRRPINLLKLP